MTGPNDTPRVLPVVIPTIPSKGPNDTDAQLLRKVANRIDRSALAGHNVIATAAQVLRNAAAALDESGEPDPESSYRTPSTDSARPPITLEWTDRDGEVQGHLVYVLYSEEPGQRPLYVGKTVDLVGRLVAHRSGPARKKWFRNVSRVVITPCADKAAATAAELELIQALNPVYNVQRFKVS